MVRVSSIVEKDNIEYKVIKVFNDGHIDVISVKPTYRWDPKFRECKYSEKLSEYNIVKY